MVDGQVFMGETTPFVISRLVELAKKRRVKRDLAARIIGIER